MSSKNEELEFVQRLFSYVLSKHSTQNSSLLFVDNAFTDIYLFTGQIGRTVLLLSHVFYDLLLKHFRLIFPHVVESKRNFMSFLSSFSSAKESTESVDILGIIALSAVVIDLGVFCYNRGYEYAFTLSSECLIEILKARSEDIRKCGGWDTLTVESIPFSRAFYVLQHLMETRSPKLKIDPVTLVSDIVLNAFDESTNIVLQSMVGSFPLFARFLEDTSDSETTEYSDSQSGLSVVCKSRNSGDYLDSNSDESSSSEHGNFVIRESDKVQDKVNPFYLNDCVVKCKNKMTELRLVKNNAATRDVLKGKKSRKGSCESLNKASSSSSKKDEHEQSSKTSANISYPEHYGVPHWKRRILELREQRLSARLSRKHQCKVNKCEGQKNVELSSVTPHAPNNANPVVYVPVVTTPILQSVECLESVPEDGRYIYQFDFALPTYISTIPLSENKENILPVLSSEHRQIENIKGNHPTLASKFLAMQSEAMKSLTKATDISEKNSSGDADGLLKQETEDSSQTNAKSVNVSQPNTDISPGSSSDLPSTTAAIPENSIRRSTPLEKKNSKRVNNKRKGKKGKKKKRN